MPQTCLQGARWTPTACIPPPPSTPTFRGLFGLPLGVVFVAAALGNEEWGPLRHPWAFLAVLAVAGAAAAGINRWYAQRFGRITPTPRQQTREAATGALGAALLFCLATLLRSHAAWSLDLPVNPIPAAFALLMLAYYAIVVGLRAHHVAVWGALLVVGLLPVWDGADPGNVGLVLAGVAAAVNGVLDHLALLRRFPPAAIPDPGARGAGG